MEQRSKQRLIGAVVLVALGVIFLPMLLSGPVEQTRVDIEFDVPPAPEVPPQSELPSADSIAAPEPGASLADETRPEPEAAIAEEAPSPPMEPSAEAPEEPSAEVPEEPSAEASDPAESVDHVSDGVFVQVGAFQSHENARRLLDELEQGEIPVRLVEIDNAQETRYRVHAGPFEDRSAAETASQALADQHGLSGFLIEP